MKCSCGIGNSYLAYAGPSLGYALEFNFAAGIVGCHCAVVGDGAAAAAQEEAAGGGRGEAAETAGGVLVLNSNEETAHNERATSKAYAHSLAR